MESKDWSHLLLFYLPDDGQLKQMPNLQTFPAIATSVMKLIQFKLSVCCLFIWKKPSQFGLIISNKTCFILIYPIIFKSSPSFTNLRPFSSTYLLILCNFSVCVFTCLDIVFKRAPRTYRHYNMDGTVAKLRELTFVILSNRFWYF